ncbi:hypothetical protein U9M48_023662 [Paspalum notatum var. saurae]|uniref:Uncharacterized protein n=1 Tax=Paspalum notatum var. saurae TaxID=547442 RepID=A0AAQ3WVY4_PASNO
MYTSPGSTLSRIGSRPSRAATTREFKSDSPRHRPIKRSLSPTNTPFCRYIQALALNPFDGVKFRRRSPPLSYAQLFRLLWALRAAFTTPFRELRPPPSALDVATPPQSLPAVTKPAMRFLFMRSLFLVGFHHTPLPAASPSLRSGGAPPRPQRTPPQLLVVGGKPPLFNLNRRIPIRWPPSTADRSKPVNSRA